MSTSEKELLSKKEEHDRLVIKKLTAQAKSYLRRTYRWSAETLTSREFAKAMTWRAVASTDTFALCSLVSGNMHQAVKIAGIEVFTKTPTFYIHEKVWKRIAWGRDDLSKSALFRAAAKTVSYRLFGTFETFLWASLISGHPHKAGIIASAELVTKSGLYFVHDLAWRLQRELKQKAELRAKRGVELGHLLISSPSLLTSLQQKKYSLGRMPQKYILPTRRHWLFGSITNTATLNS